MEKDTVDRLIQQWRAERPDLDVSQLGLAIRIEKLAKLMQRDTAKSLSKLRLKPWEYDVLSALRRQGEPFEMPATELAKASLLTSGAMTTRIDQLEVRQLVSRKPDPDDRRGVRIFLTKQGVALIDKAIGARLTAAASGTRCLTRKERVSTDAALRKLLIAAEV